MRPLLPFVGRGLPGPALALALCLPVAAQDAPPGPISIAESHRAAALDLLTAMETPRMLEAAREIAVRSMVESNPAVFQDIRDIFESFMAKYLNWDTLREDYVRIYTQSHTEEELLELAQFMRTPVGRRMVEEMPVIYKKSAQAGQQAVQAHLPELERLITERLSGGD